MDNFHIDFLLNLHYLFEMTENKRKRNEKEAEDGQKTVKYWKVFRKCFSFTTFYFFSFQAHMTSGDHNVILNFRGDKIEIDHSYLPKKPYHLTHGYHIKISSFHIFSDIFVILILV